MSYSTSQETLQALVDQLSSSSSNAAGQAARGGSVRAAIVTRIWTQVLQSDAKKDELLKLSQAVLPRMLHMMEATCTDAEGAYAAAGCMACLVHHPKWLDEITATGSATNKVVSACLTLLRGCHDRSRLPAAQILLRLSQQPGLVPRLEPCLPTLLALLSQSGGPGWAGGRQLATAAAGILQALLEPSEFESEIVRQARRQSCLRNGAVSALLGQLQGANEPLLLAVAACLRFLALAPAAADVLAGDPTVAEQLLLLLSRGDDSVRAFVSGILWELAATPATAQQIFDAGAVPTLLAVVHDTAAAAGPGAKKGGKKAGKKSKDSGKELTAQKKGAGRPASGKAKNGEAASLPASVLLQDPAEAAKVALCNATGALHHLSFLDEAKQQLGESNQLHVLVNVLKKATGQTYDNIVGCLWNVGLLADNAPRLAAAGAPAHLVRPVPVRWTCAPGGT